MSLDIPLIGLTGRRGTGTQVGAPAGFASAPLDVYLSEYATSIIAAGGLPVHLPLDVDPRAAAARLDGLLLAGGEDVSPEHYGQLPGPRTGPCSLERDAFELAVAEAAIDRRIPVLGVCRGAQLLNVLRGGTLIQHLPDTGEITHAPGVQARVERTHRVALAPGSVLADVYGSRTAVNSFHHQAIDVPGKGVRITATAPDGVVEGIEFEDAPVVATQWHPETFTADPIFDWFISATIDRINNQGNSHEQHFDDPAPQRQDRVHYGSRLRHRSPDRLQTGG